MSAPPSYAIECARRVALRSPCAKSKRGVVLFTWEAKPEIDRDILVVLPGEAFNGPPPGFSCTGSDACRRDCAKLCMHAEQRAILYGFGRVAGRIAGCDLLHVKVVNGEVVPGGGPSCWQCSRLVVEVGLRGVWLYELVGDVNEPRLLGTDEKRGLWIFYTAEECHRETLRACGIGVGA
jgi:deoxycytidylate deaminase